MAKLRHVLACAVLILEGCARLNPAFGDDGNADGTGGGGGGGDGTGSGATVTTLVTESASGSGTTSFDASSSDVTSTDGDSTTGDDLFCEHIGYDISVRNLAPCEGDGPFFVRACAEFGPSEVFADGLHAETTVACGANDQLACGAPLLNVDVDINVEGYPLADIVSTEGTPCGSVWFVGRAEKDECIIDGVYVYDQGDQGLRIVFSNFVSNQEVEMRMSELATPQMPEFVTDSECGEPDPECMVPAPGLYAIRLGDGVAQPDGEPVDAGLVSSTGLREMVLVNDGSRIEADCKQSGKWAAIDADVAEQLEIELD